MMKRTNTITILSIRSSFNVPFEGHLMDFTWKQREYFKANYEKALVTKT